MPSSVQQFSVEPSSNEWRPLSEVVRSVVRTVRIESGGALGSTLKAKETAG